MKTKIILFIAFIAMLSAGLFFSYKVDARSREIKKGQALLADRRKAWLNLEKILQAKVKHFNGTVGIVIEDLDTGWDISFNENISIPSASLVKIPIMMACFQAQRDRLMSLKSKVRLKSEDKVSGSKVLGSKPAGSVFRVEDLLGPMITQSDNAAANALIDFLGFDRLNAYFKKMGLRNTNIVRKMMDFQERKEGRENYTTAKDMAYLLEELYRGRFLNKDISQRCLEILGQQKINDRIPRKLPKGICVAHKTGLERFICHDVGIVYTDKGDFLICVLVEHGNRYAKPAKKFISDVTLLTYNYFQNLK